MEGGKITAKYRRNSKEITCNCLVHYQEIPTTKKIDNISI